MFCEHCTVWKATKHLYCSCPLLTVLNCCHVFTWTLQRAERRPLLSMLVWPLARQNAIILQVLSYQVQLEDKAGRPTSCFAHCNAVLSKSFHPLSSLTYLSVMFASHRPRVFRSRLGCCICGAKSSSSRFTSSSKYEVLFSGCFQLNEKRQGEICNACVLLVKRWKKLPPGSSKNWKHVS